MEVAIIKTPRDIIYGMMHININKMWIYWYSFQCIVSGEQAGLKSKA